ncbi:MAG: histidine kinase [Emticicia sp.]|nr:histidine kinase [Emticicia sp.]
MKKHQVEIKWQGTIFGVYFILGIIQTYSENPASGISFGEFIGIINVVLSECLLVNLLANWLMLKYPFSEQPRQYLLYFSLLFVGFLIYRYLTTFPSYVDILKTYERKNDKPSVIFFSFISCINFTISFLVALGLFSVKKSIRMEKRARRLESEVNTAKLATLKYQVNPHFLYNTLSYMYAQARPVSDNLAKSILILSDMMRYSLNKTEENGVILIEKEIHYIENFIEIHRLRFGDDFYVNFEIEGIINGKRIVPLLLITFIENAIKHGKINEEKYPVLIKISIEKKTLTLFVENYKQHGKKDETSGIGLENTKKRLNLLYPNQHTLEIINKTDTFTVTLKINFDKK